MSIKVSGQGKLKLKPDQVVIRVQINTESSDYKTVLQQNEKNTIKLKEALIQATLNDEDLKTESYTVNQFQDEKKRMYHVNHEISIKFDFIFELLNQIIEAIVESNTNASFNVDFEVKDKTKAQAMLFKKAREDAYAKAKSLTSLEGKVLGDVINIDATQFQAQFRSMSTLRSVQPVSNFTPQDIKLETTVHYEWEVKDS